MEDLTIRLLDTGDGHALELLAQRDSARVPRGPVLAAVSDEGSLLAAVSLDGTEVVADPFRRTADAVGMLRLRARQIRGETAPQSKVRTIRPWRRSPSAAAPAASSASGSR